MKEINDLKEFAAFARRMPTMQRMAMAGKLADDAIEKTVALVERLDARIARLEGLLSRHQETIAAMIGDSNASEAVRVRAIFEGGDYGG